MEENWLEESMRTYERLLELDYEITVGKKGVLQVIDLKFEKSNFHHLAGLHYLKDRPMLKRNSDKVFDALVTGKIKIENITNSMYYKSIEPRLEALSSLEDLLDSEFYIYKYNHRKNHFSNIKADYVIKAFTKNGKTFFFLAKENHCDNEVRGCSIFIGDETDYTTSQARLTVLSITKKPRPER